VCWSTLDFEMFHPIKSDALGLQLCLDRSQVSRALQNLVDFGYLDAGPRDDKGVGTYRLPRRVDSGVRQMHTSAKVARIRRQVRDSL
jgi:predicted transcriptional regulator